MLRHFFFGDQFLNSRDHDQWYCKKNLDTGHYWGLKGKQIQAFTVVS